MMKTLLETIFALLFIAMIIINLPSIMGFISLCVIIYFVFSLFVGGSKHTTDNYDRQRQTSKQNENSNRRTMQNEQKTESETIRIPKSYSGYSYPRYRQSNYDSYDDYYDDWRDDDMPPDEGDGFRGTGAPFL